jgi:hypothetical protein
MGTRFDHNTPEGGTIVGGDTLVFGPRGVFQTVLDKAEERGDNLKLDRRLGE